MVAKFQFIVLLLQRCFVWSKGDHTHQAIMLLLKVPMKWNFLFTLFKIAVKWMKNGIYFVVLIAILVPELFKILIYAN